MTMDNKLNAHQQQQTPDQMFHLIRTRLAAVLISKGLQDRVIMGETTTTPESMGITGDWDMYETLFLIDRDTLEKRLQVAIDKAVAYFQEYSAAKAFAMFQGKLEHHPIHRRMLTVHLFAIE